MNKIVIFGANGMLGQYIYKYFANHTTLTTISITRDSFDVVTDNLEKLVDIFKMHNIDDKTVIFNAIGVIPQVKPPSNHIYYQVNTVFPMILSHVCDSFKCRLVHPTTDCVFSGSQGMYTEDSIHDATSHYGISKSLGENIRGTIIRVSVIGETSRKISLIEWIKNNRNGRVNGYVNHIWNGITCLEYAKVLHQIILKNVFWEGVRHIKSPNAISKADLIKLVNEAFELHICIDDTIDAHTRDMTLSSNYNIDLQINDLEVQIHELALFAKEL
jgi:dTDP-4-dehydrorhamnose reductase